MDLKSWIISAGIVYGVSRMPPWAQAIIGIIVWGIIILGTIALWRANFFGAIWPLVSMIIQGILALLKIIFWNLPGDLICYIFSGHGCTTWPAHIN